MILEPLPPGLRISDHQKAVRPDDLACTRHFGAFDIMRVVQPGGSFPDPVGPRFDLQLVMQGDTHAQIEFGGHHFDCQSSCGTLVLAPAGEDCGYELASDHDVIVVSLPLAAVALLAEQLELSFDGTFGRLHDQAWKSAEVRRIALSIWEAASDPESADPDELFMLLIEALERAAGHEMDHSAEAQLEAPVLSRVVHRIEGDLATDHRLFALAQEFDMSPARLSTGFETAMGCSIREFVRDRRLARALNLVKRRRKLFSEIAQSTGFATADHMAEALRKRFEFRASVS